MHAQQLPYRELYYQCRFTELFTALDSMEQAQAPAYGSAEWADLLALKASALFERGQFDLSMSILKTVSSQPDCESFTVTCIRARNAFHENRLDEAESLFVDLQNRSETLDEYLISGISLANVYLTKNARKDFEVVVADLAGVDDLWRDDLRLCLYLAEAKADMLFHNDYEAAKERIVATIQEAQKKTWNYFTIKGFFSLARLYQEQGRAEAAKDGLAMLFCYLDCDQSIYLSDLVRKNFARQNPTVAEYIRLNPSAACFTIGGKVISLQEKPLLYSFIEVLYPESTYISKATIAKALWPNEPFHPSKHNARISDLARRLKQVLEDFDQQPVRLISGRTGFRLSTTQ